MSYSLRQSFFEKAEFEAVVGHRTREIFGRYNITSDENLRQAVKQTAENHSAQSIERKNRFHSQELEPAENHKAASVPPCGFITN